MTAADLMEVDDIMSALRKPRTSVNHMCKTGKLPAVKIGRHWYVPRASFLALFVQAGGVNAGVPTEGQGAERVKDETCLKTAGITMSDRTDNTAETDSSTGDGFQKASRIRCVGAASRRGSGR